MAAAIEPEPSGLDRIYASGLPTPRSTAPFHAICGCAEADARSCYRERR